MAWWSNGELVQNGNDFPPNKAIKKIEIKRELIRVSDIMTLYLFNQNKKTTMSTQMELTDLDESAEWFFVHHCKMTRSKS